MKKKQTITGILARSELRPQDYVSFPESFLNIMGQLNKKGLLEATIKVLRDTFQEGVRLGRKDHEIYG